MWSGRKIVWVVWSINSVLSIIYMIVAAKSFSDINQVYHQLEKSKKDTADWSKLITVGVLAGIILSILMCAFYIVLTFFVMMGRCCGNNMELGVGYGILVTSPIYTSAYLLLSSIMINSAKFLYEGYWSSVGGGENMYQATYALGFVLVGTFFIMFILQLVFRESFKGSGSVETTTLPPQPLEERIADDEMTDRIPTGAYRL